MTTALLDIADRFAKAEGDPSGFRPTGIPGLGVVRAVEPSGLLHAVARPLVCMVLQGCKQVATGGQALAFSAGDTLLISADVPTVSRITRADVRAPYLSLVIELDAGRIADLVLEAGEALPSKAERLKVEPTDAEVADAALRLMRLLDRPAAAAVLQAPLLRELHYWLLAGRHGAAIGQLGWPDGHARRVARAVALLRAGYAGPLPVERLAAAAGMSPSSFHHHFRAATSLSPLQFQKRLRLIEARRLMLSDGAAAGDAAFAVGYESVPQFTREYRRLFGAPPVREVETARGLVQAA